MGKEIVYCNVCGDRLLESQFTSGKAISIGNKHYCVKCKVEALENLSPGALPDEPVTPRPRRAKSSALLRAVGAQIPPSDRTKTPPSTRRIQIRQRPAPPAGSKTSMIVGGVIGAVALILLIVVATSGPGSNGEQPPVDRNTNSTGSHTDRPTDDPKPDDPARKREARAKRVLAECREYRETHGDDPDATLSFLDSKESAISNTESWPEFRKLREEVRKARDAAVREKEARRLIKETEDLIRQDVDFDKYDEIRKAADEARSVITAKGLTSLLDELRLVEGPYFQRYEDEARRKYKRIFGIAGEKAKDGEYAEAIKMINAFPKKYRKSASWRELETLKREYEERLSEEKPEPTVGPPPENEWTAIFNGEDTRGWRRPVQIGERSDSWECEGGSLVGESSHDEGDKPDKDILDLFITEWDRYGDFEITFSYKVEKGRGLGFGARLAKVEGKYVALTVMVTSKGGWADVRIEMKGSEMTIIKGENRKSGITRENLPERGHIFFGLPAGAKVLVKDVKVRRLN